MGVVAGSTPASSIRRCVRPRRAVTGSRVATARFRNAASRCSSASAPVVSSMTVVAIAEGIVLDRSSTESAILDRRHRRSIGGAQPSMQSPGTVHDGQLVDPAVAPISSLPAYRRAVRRPPSRLSTASPRDQAGVQRVAVRAAASGRQPSPTRSAGPPLPRHCRTPLRQALAEHHALDLAEVTVGAGSTVSSTTLRRTSRRATRSHAAPSFEAYPIITQLAHAERSRRRWPTLTRCRGARRGGTRAPRRPRRQPHNPLDGDRHRGLRWLAAVSPGAACRPRPGVPRVRAAAVTTSPRSTEPTRTCWSCGGSPRPTASPPACRLRPRRTGRDQRHPRYRAAVPASPLASSPPARRSKRRDLQPRRSGRRRAAGVRASSAPSGCRCRRARALACSPRVRRRSPGTRSRAARRRDPGVGEHGVLVTIVHAGGERRVPRRLRRRGPRARPRCDGVDLPALTVDVDDPSPRLRPRGPSCTTCSTSSVTRDTRWSRSSPATSSTSSPRSSSMHRHNNARRCCTSSPAAARCCSPRPTSQWPSRPATRVASARRVHAVRTGPSRCGSCRCRAADPRQVCRYRDLEPLTTAESPRRVRSRGAGSPSSRVASRSPVGAPAGREVCMTRRHRLCDVNLSFRGVGVGAVFGRDVFGFVYRPGLGHRHRDTTHGGGEAGITRGAGRHYFTRRGHRRSPVATAGAHRFGAGDRGPPATANR